MFTSLPTKRDPTEIRLAGGEGERGKLLAPLLVSPPFHFSWSPAWQRAWRWRRKQSLQVGGTGYAHSDPSPWQRENAQTDAPPVPTTVPATFFSFFFSQPVAGRGAVVGRGLRRPLRPRRVHRQRRRPRTQSGGRAASKKISGKEVPTYSTNQADVTEPVSKQLALYRKYHCYIITRLEKTAFTQCRGGNTWSTTSRKRPG